VREERHSSGALDGVRVLVTRPRDQADRLAHLIEREGGTAVRFPVIEIVDPRDPHSLRRTIDHIEEYDLAIFVSPNAVQRALPALQMRPGGIPKKLEIACVGQGGVRALKTFGIPHPLAPLVRFDSEALLELPALQQVAGKRIVIFRGEGGRELLGQTLQHRGALVTYTDCYRRQRPPVDPAAVRALANKPVDIVCVTSAEGLRNLVTMVDEKVRSWLLKTPIVALNLRQAGVCRETGFSTEPVLAREASDEAIVEAIKTWRAAQKPI
jgi:uroporphyrinogen-III synthase